MSIRAQTMRSGPRRASLDFSRLRRQFQGKPTNTISYGVVGHYDENPAFARQENGRILVEVTLLPSGDEVIARLEDPGGGGDMSVYMPLRLGMRVVVGFPPGDDVGVIHSRVSDETWPFPSAVAGVSTEGQPLESGSSAPAFAFVRTPGGCIVAVESGPGGDILVRSGASVRVEVDPGEQVLVRGRIHVGSDVDFATPPKGAVVGPAGEVVPGEEGGAFFPLPNTNEVLPPAIDLEGPLPADGVVRLKDELQSNPALDPAFWEFIIFIWSVCVLAAVLVGIPVPPRLADGPPVKLTSKPRAASRSTVGDS